MKDYILDLIKETDTEFQKINTELQTIATSMADIFSKNYNTISEGTTSLYDCKFLSLLVLKYKPKLILEIGTFIGMTAYSMALAGKSKISIHTVDVYDRFVDLQNGISDTIIRHSGLYSYDFLPKCQLSNVDMFFIDANITKKDCEDLHRMANSSFILATHDYFSSPAGSKEKGYEVMEMMKEVLNEKNSQYTEYIPKPEWYHGSDETMRVNGCCGLIVCDKK